MAVPASITPAKIRAGDPGALAALCERQGAAVFAYCEWVASPGHASIAAADAFAHFRVAVLAPGDLTGPQAAALLRRMTCHAAAWRGVNSMAAREGHPVSDVCPGLETGLVDYVEDILRAPDREGVAEHVSQCPACTAALRRLNAGKRAFDRPPRAALPPHVVEELVRALIVAAPVRAHRGNATAALGEALHLLGADLPRPPTSTSQRPRAPRPAASPPAGATSPVAGSLDRDEGPRQAGREPGRARRGSRHEDRPRPRLPAAQAAPPGRAPSPFTRTSPRGRSPSPDSRVRAPASRLKPRLGTVLALLAVAVSVGALALLTLTSPSDLTVSPVPSSPADLGGSREQSSDGARTPSRTSTGSTSPQQRSSDRPPDKAAPAADEVRSQPSSP